MFKFLVGCIVGFFAGFVSLVMVLVSDAKFDMSVVTNLVIAAATVMATTIHFSSIRQQRKDRLWDINKPILLGLSKSLSAVIKASEFYLQEEYACQYIDDAPSQKNKPGPNVYKQFDQLNDNIDHSVHEYDVDHISAYEASISVNEDLQKKLSFFITKMSGVNDI